MTNLLPLKNRQTISREYRARFILAGSFLAISAALFTLLTLSPSFGVLMITRPEAVAQASRAQQSKGENSDIVHAQTLVAHLAPVFAASSSIATAIREALAKRPHGVTIQSIGFTAEEKNTMVLGGEGENRVVLDTYRTALQADPNFTAVQLPVGDLVSFRGGRFTITLTPKF
jgi:hypothetical protein